MQRKKVIFSVVLFIFVIGFAGCNLFERESDERTIDYTVISENDVPDELKAQIESGKSGVMKFTYTDDEYLYIVKGYGTQKYGGYSIKMVQFYAKDKALYFETELIEPEEGEKVSKENSEPFIIIKTEKTDLPVVFK